MLYDYSRLTSRIEEVFGSQETFGMAMDWSRATTKRKLSNESKWIIAEIHKATQLLGISSADCSSYFFTLKDQDQKENIISTHHNGHVATKLFGCLSTELQESFLAFMRQMVENNNAEQVHP